MPSAAAQEESMKTSSAAVLLCVLLLCGCTKMVNARYPAEQMEQYFEHDDVECSAAARDAFPYIAPMTEPPRPNLNDKHAMALYDDWRWRNGMRVDEHNRKAQDNERKYEVLRNDCLQEKGWREVEDK
jgi:hypothetical protein